MNIFKADIPGSLYSDQERAGMRAVHVTPRPGISDKTRLTLEYNTVVTRKDCLSGLILRKENEMEILRSNSWQFSFVRCQLDRVTRLRPSGAAPISYQQRFDFPLSTVAGSARAADSRLLVSANEWNCMKGHARRK